MAVCVLLFIAVSALSVPLELVRAAGTSVSISPASQTVANGATFNVSLVINTATASRGWQANVSFDASKLTLNSVTEGTFLSAYATANGGGTIAGGSVSIDNTNGVATIPGWAITGAGTDGPNGIGTLAILNFTAKSSVNNWASITPASVIISDVNANTIPGVTVTGGQVGIGTLTITSTSTTTTSTTTSTTISTTTSNSMPTITSFAPTSGGNGTSVVITGSNLIGATVVGFGGTAASSFMINSATQITAIVGNGSIGVVTVTTPGGTASSTSSFTYNSTTTTTTASNSMPTISSFSPASGISDTSVVITGTNLVGATAVNFGVTAAQSFMINSATQITARVGGGSSGAISVTTPGGTASSSSNFTFGSASTSAPTISSFSPTSGGSGASVVITGTNLTGATAVSFGGTAAQSFVVNSATQITAAIGSGSSGVITVITPNGSASSSQSFTFTSTSNSTAASASAPTITSFLPASGGSGTSVVITGTNLIGATAVSFGGTAAQGFTVVSPTGIIAMVGNGSSGVISISTPNGTGSSTASFSFKSTPTSSSTSTTTTNSASASVPTIISFSPLSGGSGTSVVITGTNLTGATAVSFGGIATQNFVVNSATQIIATAGNGAEGVINITTPDGIATSPSVFTFNSISTTVPPTTPTTVLSNNKSAVLTFDLTGLTNAVGSFIKDYSDQKSADGSVTFIARLDIKAGTTALTQDNTPIGSVIITTQDLLQVPKSSRTVIAAFECSPNGSVFSSPIDLTIRYDPSLIPSGVSEKDLGLAYYDTAKNAWASIDSQLDPANHIITGEVRHFSLFGILPKEAPLASWKIVAVVVGSEVVIICVVLFLILRWRKQKKVADSYANVSTLKGTSENVRPSQAGESVIISRDVEQSGIQKMDKSTVSMTEGEEKLLQSIEINKGNTDCNSVDIFLEYGEDGYIQNTPIKITLKRDASLDSENTLKIRISKLPKSKKA